MVYGINGNGGINPPSFKKVCFGNTNGVDKTAKQPIDMTVKSENNQIGRTDLDQLSKVDKSTIEFRKVAEDANITLADMGVRYRVTPAQVASVQNIIAQQAVPGLDQAGENATYASVENGLNRILPELDKLLA